MIKEGVWFFDTGDKVNTSYFCLKLWDGNQDTLQVVMKTNLL